MRRDPDAWLRNRQPTAELCRLFHGIDCKLCGFVAALARVTP